jgi:hypothetical protein
MRRLLAFLVIAAFVLSIAPDANARTKHAKEVRSAKSAKKAKKAKSTRKKKFLFFGQQNGLGWKQPAAV